MTAHIKITQFKSFSAHINWPLTVGFWLLQAIL